MKALYPTDWEMHFEEKVTDEMKFEQALVKLLELGVQEDYDSECNDIAGSN